MDVLTRAGWRLTKSTTSGAWQFVQPHVARGARKIGQVGNQHWIMVRSKSGDVWEIVRPKIVNHKVTNVTVSAFKLVKDTSTGAWKLVAPVVKPTGKLAAEHLLNIGGHVFNLAWMQTKKSWDFIATPIAAGLGKVNQHMEKYFPNLKQSIGEGIKNAADTTMKVFNHARSRLGNFDYFRPQLKKPELTDNMNIK